MEFTDNLNIKDFKSLITPEKLKQQMPSRKLATDTVFNARRAVQNILAGSDNRRMAIIGPCSLYDVDSSMDYAHRVKKLQQKVQDKLLLIMRTYFEKPRTTLGWKGMLYDPYLDDSSDIENGILMARKILLDINEMAVPCATEVLDIIIPQYLADMLSWAAIGARTTESQIHRQMASGLSMPIGFKNATDGNLKIAIDAVKSARAAHSFLGIDRNGKVIIAETKGNKFGHLVMRGGTDGPNYASANIAFAEVLLQEADIENRIIVDCSHANSYKDYRKQREALLDTAGQIKKGNRSIAGIMLESFIEQGSQKIDKPENLKYGTSITDSCIGWEETEELVLKLAEAIVV